MCTLHFSPNKYRVFMISSKIQLGSPAATDIRKILFDLITYFQTVGVTVCQVLILILAS